MSFDIPAYRFDLSPFFLSDGKEHEITVRVEGGDAQGGVWYLDAALVLYHNASLAPIRGELLEVFDSGSQVETTHGAAEGGGYSWSTSGSHRYSTRGILSTGDGKSIEYLVRGSVETTISNQLTDSASTQLTSGMLHSQAMESRTSSSTELSYHTFSQTLFPFHINSTYLQDDTTFDISASIEMSYRRFFADSITSSGLSKVASSMSDLKDLKSAFLAPQGDLLEMSSVEWSNNLASSAEYNRTLDHSTVFVMSDTAQGNYRIASAHGPSSSAFPSASGSLCYLREVSATEGEVVSDVQQGYCGGSGTLPNGKYVCGYELCQGNPFHPLSSAASAVIVAKPPLDLQKQSPEKQSRPAAMDSSTMPPFRHPLMGKRTLQEVTIIHPPN
jgi:hypothetical protein